MPLFSLSHGRVLRFTPPNFRRPLSFIPILPAQHGMAAAKYTGNIGAPGQFYCAKYTWMTQWEQNSPVFQTEFATQPESNGDRPRLLRDSLLSLRAAGTTGMCHHPAFVFLSTQMWGLPRCRSPTPDLPSRRLRLLGYFKSSLCRPG